MIQKNIGEINLNAADRLKNFLEGIKWSKGIVKTIDYFGTGK